MTEHHLKTWPEFFGPLVTRVKKAEVRLDDRGFEVGDELVLEEWDPVAKTYTGRVQRRWISHVLRDSPGLAQGYVLLSFEALA